MKRKVSIVCFLVAMLWASNIFAQSATVSGNNQQNQELTNSPVTNTNSNQEQGQDQVQQQIYAPQSNDNFSVGGWPYGSAFAPGLMDIPLQERLLMNQWNEGSASEFFRALPENVTMQVVATYKKHLALNEGEKTLRRMEKDINKRVRVFYEYSPTGTIIPAIGVPKAAVKGRDYKSIAQASYMADDEDIASEDLTMLLLDKGMQLGADMMIATGEGSKRLLQARSGAGSIVAALAQVFKFSDPMGLNISPAAGFSQGSNNVDVEPFLRVAYIKVLNPAAFAPPTNLDMLRNLIIKLEAELLNCPYPDLRNAQKRMDLAYLYIKLFIYVEAELEKDRALVKARDHFSQALRDGVQGDLKIEVFVGLSSCWLEMARRTSANKQPYLQNTLKWAQAAQVNWVPDPKILLENRKR